MSTIPQERSYQLPFPISDMPRSAAISEWRLASMLGRGDARAREALSALRAASLTPDEFTVTSPDLGAFVARALELDDAGEPVDEITITAGVSDLDLRDRLDSVLAHLNRMSYAASEADAATLVRRIQQASTLRRTLLTITNLLIRGQRADADVLELLDAGEREMARLRARMAPLLPGDEGDEEGTEDAAAALQALMPKTRDFPLYALPRPIQEYVNQAARALSAPAEYVAIPALVAAASAIGAARAIEVKPGWRELPAIWAVVVGATGSAKSPALRAALEPVDKEQRRLERRFEQDIRTWQAQPPEELKRAPEPYLRQVKTSDATVEALTQVLATNSRGVLMARDELSALTRSLNQYRAGRGADREFFLSAWACAPILTNRVGRHVSVPSPLLCITGTLPPDILGALAEEQGREDGFIHRFLFAWPESTPNRWRDAVVTKATRTAYHSLFERLYTLEVDVDAETGETRPRVLQLSVDAESLFKAYYDMIHERAEDEATSETLRGPLAKMPVQVARLALTLHVCRLVSDETQRTVVDGDSMRSAIALAHYFISAAERVYAHLTTPARDAKVAQLLRRMREHKQISITRRQLIRARIAGVSNRQDAHALFEDVQRRGLGTVVSTRSRGGEQETLTIHGANWPINFDARDSSTLEAEN